MSSAPSFTLSADLSEPECRSASQLALWPSSVPGWRCQATPQKRRWHPRTTI
jgi:hypothetical protein